MVILIPTANFLADDINGVFDGSQRAPCSRVGMQLWGLRW